MVVHCDHNGFHSGVGKLASDYQSIRFVVICDGCGEEMHEVHVEEYSPGFDPSGTDARRAA